MRKIKTLLAILCIVFAACAVMACDGGNDEPTKIAVDAPVINSKVYNGEKQAANIEANEAYAVIENNGGVNAGEYNVVLKLTDENAYEWKTPDEADATMLTLKFVITKATNSVSELTLEGWRAGETANVPAANAEFGEVKFAYATEQNGAYTENVPTAAGTYFVKAYVEATENYDGAEAVISFVITKAKEENAVTVSADDIKYGENVTPVVTANATHVPDGAEIVYTYALTSDGEYVAWETIEKRAGAYFVKATVAEDDDYKGTSAVAEFEMTKGDNAINDFVIDAVACKQAINLNVTATAGTVVTYKYATTADGEYIDIPADGLVSGTYYVKAYTAGNKNYVAAESNPATLTVNHAYAWTTDADGNDYRACACGATERFVFDTSADVFEKTESGYSLKLYSAEEEGKPDKVTFSFIVTLGTTVTGNAVMAWEQSPEGIVKITGSAEYTVKALVTGETVLTATYTDPDGKKAHVTINVTVERVTKTVEVAHETILADLATAEIDLSFASTYLGESASLAYGDKVLGNGALTDGKLTVDLSEIAETGNLTFVAATDKDGVYYSFNVNVLFATKIIRNAEDMAAVKITADQLSAYTPIEGYYVLGNDIDFANAQSHADMSSVLKTLTDQYWNKNQGFRGTFDGLEHKITNVKVGQGGLFGYVGMGAVIKNVDFENVSYIGAYCGSLLGYSVLNATVKDVNISVSAYKNPGTADQGFLGGRLTGGNTLTNVKIDASTFDVYSLFGTEVNKGAYTGVEIKVKSYVVYSNAGSDVNAEDKSVVPDGITVYSSKTVEIEHETILLEKTDTVIDLSFASEYLGESVSLIYNGALLGEGAVADGKLTVDLSGVSETGALVFVGSTLKNSVTYTFDVNVLLATKIIRIAEDLEVVRVKTTTAVISGLYVLGNDIDMQGAKVSEVYTNLPGYWETKFGFIGTFDGQNHTISNFIAGQSGLFGHIGKGAIIKDVNFSNVDINKDYLSAVFARGINGAELSNVTINIVGFAGATNDNGIFASRYFANTILKNVKVDANSCDVYSLFGNEVSGNTYNGVEIKVKSYTVFANQGSDVNSTDKAVVPDGVTVITADTTTEA